MEKILPVLPLLVGIFGGLAYLPTLWDIHKGAKQNLATWALWALLDTIVAISVFVQNGNVMLPIVYACGSFSVAIFLIYKRQVGWGWFETIIAGLVIICMCIWTIGGPKAATIASTLATASAGLPQLWATIKDPKQTSPLTYGLFTLANICSVLGVKAWTIEESFFPVVAGSICLLFFAFSLRRYMR